MNQTPEERAVFNQKMKLIFQMKRTICEIMECDAKRIAIDKSGKKVFYINGADLQFVCALLSSGTAKWEDAIDEKIKT